MNRPITYVVLSMLHVGCGSISSLGMSADRLDRSAHCFYEQVNADRYHHLRKQLEGPDSRYGDNSLAFERVTEAYLDVDRAMNHPGSRAHVDSRDRDHDHVHD